MINFRYHLASLIAVFLALAVGVVMGSTVIDRAIVDGLRDRINTVEAKADATKAENDQLRSEVDRTEGYVDASAPFAVEGRLKGVPVQIFAVRGASDADVRRSVQRYQSAGAFVTGFLWVEPAWALPDAAAKAKLAEAAGIPVSTPRAMRAAAWKAVAAELAAMNPAVEVPLDPAATTTSAPAVAGVIARLTAAGFFGVQNVEGAVSAVIAGRSVRVVLVTATRNQVDVPGLLAVEATATVGAGLPTLAAEDYEDVDGGPDRGSTLAPVLGNAELAAEVSTVDYYEITEGHVAAAIALQQLAAGTIGHYGYGNGANQSFPTEVAP